MVAARDDITRLMTLESGKPLAESRSEFDSGWVGGVWTMRQQCGAPAQPAP